MLGTLLALVVLTLLFLRRIFAVIALFGTLFRVLFRTIFRAFLSGLFGRVVLICAAFGCAVLTRAVSLRFVARRFIGRLLAIAVVLLRMTATVTGAARATAFVVTVLTDGTLRGAALIALLLGFLLRLSTIVTSSVTAGGFAAFAA